MNVYIVIVAKVAEVTKVAKGEVRRTKFGSAAEYVFCGFAAEY